MKFFLAALHFKKIDDFMSDLSQHLQSKRFLIGLERVTDAHHETNGEHFHVAADMTDKEYDKFRNTILKRKHNLRGKVTNGLPRQYGMVHNVRDETKLLAYTCKDQNIRYVGMTLEEVQGYIALSYKKEEKYQFQNKLMEYLEYQDYTCEDPVYTPVNPKYHETVYKIDTVRLQMDILQFYMENKPHQKDYRPLSRSLLQHYTLYYMQRIMPERQNHLAQIIQFINGKI